MGNAQEAAWPGGALGERWSSVLNGYRTGLRVRDQQPGPPSPAGPGLAGKALPLACAAASRAQRLSAGRAVLRAGRARHGCPAWVPVTQLTPEGRGEDTGKKEERAGGRERPPAAAPLVEQHRVQPTAGPNEGKCSMFSLCPQVAI